MEDTTNLIEEIGRLVETLFRQWRLIVATTLACALAAGFISSLMPKSYEASAIIASTKSGSDVSLGSTIETTSDEQLLAARIIDQKTRLNSYLQLVTSPSVAQIVFDEITPQYPDEDLSVPELLDMVKGEILEGSDSIRIVAMSGDRQLSAAIANAWAEAYVNQVNTIYSEQSEIEGYSAIQIQLEKSNTEYGIAQEALEEFVSSSQVNELNRQIEQKERYITILASSQESVISETVKDMQKSLIATYENRRKVDSYLGKVEDMRSQVGAGGDGAANSSILALNLLKTELYAKDFNIIGSEEHFVHSGSNMVVQTELITTTSATMLEDLDGLILSLESREEALDESIQTLSMQMLELSYDPASSNELMNNFLSDDYSSDKLQKLEDELRILKAELEHERAVGAEFNQERDLAWESYKNLQIKAAELGVSMGIKKVALVLAAPAIPPRFDTSSGLRNILIAVVVGFILGVMAAFAIEFWWRYKGIEPYPLLTFRKNQRVAA